MTVLVTLQSKLSAKKLGTISQKMGDGNIFSAAQKIMSKSPALPSINIPTIPHSIKSNNFSEWLKGRFVMALNSQNANELILYSPCHVYLHLECTDNTVNL